MTPLSFPPCVNAFFIFLGIFLLFIFYWAFYPLIGKFFCGDYRIVERDWMGKKMYIVQRKCFHIWKDETFFTTTDDYTGYGDFETLDDAKEYVRSCKNKDKVASQ